MSNWQIPSHPKTDRLRSEGVAFDGVEVSIQEKIDGSQISFAKVDGVVMVRSRNVILTPENVGGFKAGYDAIHEIGDVLIPDAIYRGEYLAKPKQNVLAYDRTPRMHVVLWDIIHEDAYMMPRTVSNEAFRLGLEPVAELYAGPFPGVEKLDELVKSPSALGGQGIEGLVIKPLLRKRWEETTAKFLSPAFMETAQGRKRESKPGKTVQTLAKAIAEEVCTPMRWEKAANRLRDRGELVGGMKDMGRLMGEISKDIDAECEEDIKQAAYDAVIKHVKRAALTGLATWYQRRLVVGEES